MSAGSAPTAAEPKLLTAEEFLRRSPDLPEELVRGTIVPMGQPIPNHGRLCFLVAFLVESFVRPKKLGLAVTNDSGVKTESNPDTVRGADVAYYTLASLPGGKLPPKGLPAAPPALVVEVRSESDRPGEIRRKVQEYLDAGVRVVAVYDPTRQTITQHVGDAIQVFGADDLWTIPDVLPGFAVAVRELAE